MDEVIDLMELKEDGIYLDCTVGGAGHLMAMLMQTKRTNFIGIDCDPDAVEYSRQRAVAFSNRCRFIENNFINLDLILDELNVKEIDGVLFDLGVSYHQLAVPSRGFSYERDGALLMRMSPLSMPLRKKLRYAHRDEIVRILREYGDVRNYRKLGRRIFDSRSDLKSTRELRELIEDCVPRRFLKKNLQRVFQALRIWTNDELNNLTRGLPVALERLKNRGRMIVISYHSGEDRIVKRFFRGLKAAGAARLLSKKAITPSDNEISMNPQARSAKLRAVEKCECS